jgi:hypothetical protein
LLGATGEAVGDLAFGDDEGVVAIGDQVRFDLRLSTNSISVTSWYGTEVRPWWADRYAARSAGTSP